MLVPLPIVIVGIAIAAVLGVAGGWILGSAAASKAHQSSADGRGDTRPSSSEEAMKADPLQEAWDSFSGPKIVFCWRLDGIDTWRRTHGQKAVEMFSSEVSQVIVGALPEPAGIKLVGEEGVAVAPGDEGTVIRAANAIRQNIFRYENGEEALVSASIGFVLGDSESLQVQLGKSFAACSEAGRKRRGSVAEWLPSGIRHVRPVDGST